jgi:hypothetical protein
MNRGMILVFALALLTCSLAANAGLLFSLDQAVLTGSPGDTVVWNVTFTNDGVDPIYLTGDSITGFTVESNLTVNEDFFGQVPLVMNGQDTWTGSFFNVMIESNAPIGDYYASVTIFGGADDQASDELASQNIGVTVVPSSAVPEPGTVLAALSILGPAGLLFRRKR